MKNKSVLIGILIIIVVCVVTTGCVMKKALDKDGFKKHFTDLGYEISENEEPKYEAESYLVATKAEYPFKIEYYGLKSEVEAKKIHEKFKNSIADYITTNSENQTTTGAVFTKTVAVSTDEYIVISRVKNTLIFVAGTKEYQKDIDKILEDITY